ncbi:MAG: hypothetical protein HC797_00390, partial [Anaerolineales bacterium]|nr:hypothetical protein [Anaerolineales bacterium]
MKMTKVQITYLMVGLIVFVLACSLPSTTDSTETITPETTEAITESAPPTDPLIQHKDIPVSLPDNQSGQSGEIF